MNSRRFLALPVCLIVIVSASVVVRADDAIDEKGIEFFEQHIRPLLVKHCYSCHSTEADKREGGLLLDSRAGWSIGGDQGPALDPGDLESSLLVRAVRYSDSDLQMPPDQKLPETAIRRLEQWVLLGAPDPRNEPLPKALGNSDEKNRPEPSDPVAGREHWAFRPLSKTQVPLDNLAERPASAIDSFIAEKLQREDLRPAPLSDKRTLARRLYFQLIGLPPTPEQLRSFLEDERSDASERLVDQLLSSPRFGERWGRHWLDLSRYADSNGLDENFLFREAWRYRNWVFEAVNADMPYDRFLREQIAGDLLPFDSIEQRDRQRIAAGFMVVGPKVLLGNDAQERIMDVADEQLDTIGKTVLGQTLGCARCHNHKFDPVPTADYYALAGILTSTQVLQQRFMLGQQRLMERLVGLGEQGDELNEAYEKYWREQPKIKERQQQAKAALELLKKPDAAAFESLAQKQATAITDAAADVRKPMEERVAAQEALVAELDQILANPPAIPPRAMIPADIETPADQAIRIAGQFDRLGESVPRGFLRVISDEGGCIPDGRSGRLELARWLTDVEHGAGQLAARVLANRVWYHLMGRGLVRTVDNFGRTGEEPSHPELLDYLAGELIDSGWSIKHLVREIALSETFAISSGHSAASHAVDPDNRLFWRANRRRLDPESLRDAMLLAAGELDVTPMDSTVWYLGDQATAVGANKNRRRTDFPCRSVYLPVIRNDLPELFDVFDFANPHATTGMRPETLVATQGLFLLNDESVMTAAQATAKRLLASVETDHPEAMLESTFEIILGVPPTDEERLELMAFAEQTGERFQADGESDPDLRAWSLVCHAIFASSRFQVLE